MKNLLKLLGLASTVTVVASAIAADLPVMPGKLAPKMDVSKWYKGAPVDELLPNKTYVIEFWASWCAACRPGISFTNALSHKFKDVAFVGIGIWETPEKSSQFVQEVGDKVEFSLGFGGNGDHMAKSWMEDATQNGIPTAFIVKNRVVQWVGWPFDLERPLTEVEAGKFDLKASVAEFSLQAEATRKDMTYHAGLEDATSLRSNGKKLEAWKLLNKLQKENPDKDSELAPTRLAWNAQDNPKLAIAMVKKLLRKGGLNELRTLCTFALTVQDQGIEASRMGEDAIKGALAKDSTSIELLWYSAHYFKRFADYDKALRYANKAIEIFPKSSYKDSPDYLDSLKKLQSEIETLARSRAK